MREINSALIRNDINPFVQVFYVLYVLFSSDFIIMETRNI